MKAVWLHSPYVGPSSPWIIAVNITQFNYNCMSIANTLKVLTTCRLQDWLECNIGLLASRVNLMSSPTLRSLLSAVTNAPQMTNIWNKHESRSFQKSSGVKAIKCIHPGMPNSTSVRGDLKIQWPGLSPHSQIPLWIPALIYWGTRPPLTEPRWGLRGTYVHVHTTCFENIVSWFVNICIDIERVGWGEGGTTSQQHRNVIRKNAYTVVNSSQEN